MKKQGRDNFYIQYDKPQRVQQIMLMFLKEQSAEIERKPLYRPGYKRKKSNNIAKISTERPNIVNWRIKYLVALNYYKTKGRNIIYLDETWADNCVSFGKCWQNEDTLRVLENPSASPRLKVVLHAEGKSGFVDEAILIFKSRSTTGDCHGQMNAYNIKKWIREKLLPNILPATVIVMGNAPYHSVQVNKPPSLYSTEKSIIAWLIENNIPHVE
ncbi:PREDICTED: uncharacterized protein LOC108553103 [Eufriesea mexicana]|uniref:uncharacterized protein LOC108553103 n=1 Tax=Eufriesea mexicana TaxID=516756 RepID=UPI00083C109D|nr:PREDICTED: uncharacterized protein LOC108553103 [Eufriesea mexicana]